MDMDQAAVFLAGSILTMLGFIVVVAGIIAINNLIHKYWKPVIIWRLPEYPVTRFAEPHELANIESKNDVKKS